MLSSSLNTAQARACFLGGLLFCRQDHAALARNGFVAVEYRWRGGRRWGPYYKLRWRRAGRQRTRYLGANPARCEQVRRELALLQAPLRQARLAAQLLLEARGHLRSLRQELTAPMAARGKQFHGYAVRRRRQGSRTARAQCNSRDGRVAVSSHVL
jgi:hypothetical protein